MTSPIVSVEIGRSTWQGPAEEAPGGAGNRDADMAECFAFSAGYEAGERDGRASGQQVRALVANLSVWAGKAHPDQQLVDLAHVLAILDSNPAPQPEGQVQRLSDAIRQACDLLAERKYGSPARSPAHNARLVLEAALTPAPDAAQTEAVPVDAFHSDAPVLISRSLITAACSAIDKNRDAPRLLEKLRQISLHQADYAHPAAPAPGIADAIAALRDCDGALKALGIPADAEPRQTARAALRALEGRDHG
ncbi:hypothetical protein [Paracoccus versutus]